MTTRPCSTIFAYQTQMSLVLSCRTARPIWIPSELMRTYLLVNSTLYIGPWFHSNDMPDDALESKGKLRWERDKEGILLCLFYAHEACSDTDALERTCNKASFIRR